MENARRAVELIVTTMTDDDHELIIDDPDPRLTIDKGNSIKSNRSWTWPGVNYR